MTPRKEQRCLWGLCGTCPSVGLCPAPPRSHRDPRVSVTPAYAEPTWERAHTIPCGPLRGQALTTGIEGRIKKTASKGTAPLIRSLGIMQSPLLPACAMGGPKPSRP